MPKVEKIEDCVGAMLPLGVTRRKERKTSPNRSLPPSIRVKCGCCDNTVEINFVWDGAALEINGVSGTVDQWRKVLLPLLGV